MSERTNQYRFILENENGREVTSRKKDLEELNALKEDDVIAFNSKAEKLFCKVLCELVREFNNRLYKKPAIDELAYRIKVSTVTSKRYLDKHTTRHAQFEIRDKLVYCKCDNHRARTVTVIKRGE